MDTTAEPKDLTEIATETYRNFQAQRDAANAEREAEHAASMRERMLRELEKVVGAKFAEGAKIDPEGTTAEVDGVRFVLLKDDYRFDLAAAKVCPDCGGSRFSYDLADLDDLGAFLVTGQGRYHECRPPVPVTAEDESRAPRLPTDAERALALVRELVDLVHVHEQEA